MSKEIEKIEKVLKNKLNLVWEKIGQDIKKTLRFEGV
jgi:hypothetical protein